MKLLIIAVSINYIAVSWDYNYYYSDFTPERGGSGGGGGGGCEYDVNDHDDMTIMMMTIMDMACRWKWEY